MKFRYLKNEGSPTRWDVSAYEKYRDHALGCLSPDLRDMISNDRYWLGTSATLWHSQLCKIQADKNEFKLIFISDSQDHFYEFLYLGVKKIVNGLTDNKAMPSLIIQELVVLRNGLLRHAMSDLGGRIVVVYAQDMRFSSVLRRNEGLSSEL
jgi:hypothetical protein